METIEILNQRLIDEYGVDTSTNQPIFRIVWANDETEMRMTDVVEGVQLLYPCAYRMKKYPYLKDLYVLERLVAVPEINRKELLDLKMSYEPVWAYRDENQQPLPPIWDATKFIVDALYAALGKKSLRKYIDPENDMTPEGLDLRITKLCDELFGNETEVTDALAYKEGIVVPPNYKKEN